MSWCIQFLKWNSLSLYFYLKNSFSKNITSYIWFLKMEWITYFFSQTSFLILSSDTQASLANKPIKFCRRKPNTWRHVSAVVVYVLPSNFHIRQHFFAVGLFSRFRGLHPEIAKNPRYVLSPEKSQKMVSAHGLYDNSK